jgi:drug/metabolite transporter superfamily protein YnfA
MTLLRAGGLFVVTAIAEILGCYLPYLWLRKGKSPLLLLPAAFSLAAFALMPVGQGRVPIDGKPAAYVCRNRTCEAPVTTVEALRARCST